MFTFETVLTMLVMAAWAMVLAALYRHFRRTSSDVLSGLVAAAAISVGLLVAIPGLLHTVAVIGSAVNQQKPYDLRFAWLLSLGLILMWTGGVNTVLGRWLKRAEPWALAMSATVTAFLLSFLIVLHPAASQGLLIVIIGGYLLLLLIELSRLARRPARHTP